MRSSLRTRRTGKGIGGAAALLLTVSLLGAAPAVAGSRFVYVLDQASDTQVYGYSLSKKGRLKALADSPFALGDTGDYCVGQCQTLAYDSRKKLLFATGADGVSVLKVKGNGRLTLVEGSPFGNAGGDYSGVALVRRGDRLFVYASDFNRDQIVGFELQKDKSLAPVPGAPFDAGEGPTGMDVAGKVLLVVNQSSESLDAFRVGSNGGLTRAPTAATGFADSPIYNVSAGGAGSFAYVAEADGDLHAFEISQSDAAITELTPVASGLGDTNSGLSGSKSRLLFAFRFAAGTGQDDVQAMRQRKDGSLGPKGEVQSSGLGFVRAHAQDKNGKRLVVTSNTAGLVQLFKVDAKGDLALIGEATSGAANPNGVVLIKR